MPFHRNSKADTRLFCNQSLDLFVDQSQWGQDLDDQGTYFDSTSTRLGVRSPREIALVVKLATTDTGIIVNWGNATGTAYSYRITIGVGGTVVFGHNNAALTSILPPNISGTAKSFLLHWSTDYDFLGTIFFSEFALCDLATGTWTNSRLTHSQPQAPAMGDRFNLLGYGAGSSLFTGGLDDITSLRIGCRFHSTTEAQEDWVSETSAPDEVGVRPEVELAPLSTSFYDSDPDSDVSDAILDSGTCAGPAEWLATVNAAAHRKRLYSPLLNLYPNNPAALANTYLPANFHESPGPGETMRWSIQYLFRRPVPPFAAHARVRVHVLCYLAPGAPGGSVIDFSVRMRSRRYLNLADGAGLSDLATCTTNHTSSGTGELLDLGSMPLATGSFSGTYLCLGYEFGSGTGASYQRAKILSIHVDPYED